MKSKILFIADPAEGGTAPVTTDAAHQVAAVSQEVISALTPFATLAGPDGEVAIVAAQALLKGYNLMLPYIEELKNKGLITADQQAAVFAKYNDVTDNLDARFAGPNWQITSQ
jgi:hypothetical protein